LMVDFRRLCHLRILPPWSGLCCGVDIFEIRMRRAHSGVRDILFWCRAVPCGVDSPCWRRDRLHWLHHHYLPLSSVTQCWIPRQKNNSAKFSCPDVRASFASIIWLILRIRFDLAAVDALQTLCCLLTRVTVYITLRTRNLTFVPGESSKLQLCLRDSHSTF